MAKMTDKQVRAELERIKKAVDIHVSWLKLQTGDWESHSMGIPVKDIVMLLDVLAESQAALRKIANKWGLCSVCSMLIGIARTAWKGGKL